MRILVLLAMLGLSTLLYAASCSPSKMVKIVVQTMTPSADNEFTSPAARLIMRHGSRYARIEDIHGAGGDVTKSIIVNEPDMWILDRKTNTVKHVKDPDPTPKFHAPIFWNAGMPDWLRDLEFGCELSFMHNLGAKPKIQELDGTPVNIYGASDDTYRVMLVLRQEDNVPYAISLFKHGKVVLALRYNEYDDDLEVDETLFRAPEGAAE